MTNHSPQRRADPKAHADSLPDPLTGIIAEAKRLASTESISDVELAEMEAINQLRMAVEATGKQQYIVHSATATP